MFLFMYRALVHNNYLNAWVHKYVWIASLHLDEYYALICFNAEFIEQFGYASVASYFFIRCQLIIRKLNNFIRMLILIF